MKNLSSYGLKVNHALLDKNMSAKELAAAVGVSPQYLSKILHGEKKGNKYREKIKEVLDLQ